MLSLVLAVVCCTAIAVIMRISIRKVGSSLCLLGANYLMCLLLGIGYCGSSNLFPADPGLPAALAMGVGNGCLFLLNFMLLQHNTRKNGIVLSNIFMKLGLLVPMAVSILVFRETPGLSHIIGFVMAIVAILLINFDRNRTAASSKLSLLVLLVSGGVADTMSKVFEQYGSAGLSGQFLLYCFATAFLLSGLLMIFKKEPLRLPAVLLGLALGIPNYYSVHFLLKALNQLDAVIVYPTCSVATLLLVTLTGAVFFKEKLQKHQWLALGIILAALVLLNI